MGAALGLNLFIDTNVLLTFYHFSGEDLEELKRLSVLIKAKKARLFVPGQVGDEFRRNREAKIADAIGSLREQKLPARYPRFCQDYAEYAEMCELQKQYEKSRSALIDKVLADSAGKSLKADGIIDELLSRGETVIVTAALLDLARIRIDLGNPPGKSGSLGDAVNWECLLDAVPDGEELHFITDDRDYASPLYRETFNEFLLDEWRARKGSDLVSYRRLSAFFAAKFPKIKLASEIEKELLIQELAASGTFRQTHSLVAKLSKWPDFTVDQASAILNAAVNNSQVGWIASDYDVRRLLESAIAGKQDALDVELLGDVLKMMGPEPEPLVF